MNLRAPRAEEAAEIAELLTAAAGESGFGVVEPEEVANWFSFPSYDIEGNFRVAERDGVLVGYCDLVPEADDATYIFMDLRGRPGADDAQAALAAWACARSRELASGRTLLRSGVGEQDVTKRGVLEELGFTAVRHSFVMLVDFEGEPAPPQWPEGIEVELLEPGNNDRAAFDAFQEAFRDAWGFVAQPFEEWEHSRLGRHDFDATLNFVAREGDEVAGVAFCDPDSATHPGYGWVQILGVRRPWRKRGLGEALLRHAFGEFHRRARKGVGLGVDAESLTGATRLYERVGMRVVSRGDTYELEVRP